MIHGTCSCSGNSCATCIQDVDLANKRTSELRSSSQTIDYTCSYILSNDFSVFLTVEHQISTLSRYVHTCKFLWFSSRYEDTGELRDWVQCGNPKYFQCNTVLCGDYFGIPTWPMQTQMLWLWTCRTISSLRFKPVFDTRTCMCEWRISSFFVSFPC